MCEETIDKGARTEIERVLNDVQELEDRLAEQNQKLTDIDDGLAGAFDEDKGLREDIQKLCDALGPICHRLEELEGVLAGMMLFASKKDPKLAEEAIAGLTPDGALCRIFRDMQRLFEGRN